MRVRSLLLVVASSCLAVVTFACVGGGDQTSVDDYAELALTDVEALRLCGRVTVQPDANWNSERCFGTTTTPHDVWGAVSEAFADHYDFFTRNIVLYVKIPKAADSLSDAAINEIARVHALIFEFFESDDDWGFEDWQVSGTVYRALQTLYSVRDTQAARIAQLVDQANSEYRGATSMFEAKLVDPKALAASERERRIADLDESAREGLDNLTLLQTLLTSIGSRYDSLRRDEGALFDAAAAFAASGSSATQTMLPTIQANLAAWYDATTARVDELGGDANVASAQTAWNLMPLKERFDNEASFLAANGLTRPQLDTDVTRALGNVAGYTDLLHGWVGDTNAVYANALELRSAALIQANADQATRDVFANNLHLKASAAFLDEANARIAEVSKAFPTTVRLKAPLLAERFALLTTFLQLEPLCASESLAETSWRQTGCIALQRQFSRARTTLATSIPTLIKLNLPTLRKEGFDATQVSAIEADLAAGRVHAAALAMDAAFLTVDSLPSVPAQTGAGPGAPAQSTSALMRAEVVPEQAGNVSIGEVRQALVARGYQRGEGGIARMEAEARAWPNELKRANAGIAKLALELDAARALKSKTSSLLSAGSVDEAKLTKMMDAIAHLRVDMRIGILEAFRNSQRTVAQIEERVGVVAQAYNTRVASLNAAVRTLSATPGLNAPANAYVPNVLGRTLPRVAIPELSTSAAVADAFASVAPSYADRVIEALNATITEGSVVDRAQFATIVRAWRQNRDLLDQAMATREAIAPSEVEALRAAEQRVESLIGSYMDASGWFLDAAVSAFARAQVDGPIARSFPRIAGSLKDAINRWPSDGSAEARLRETSLAALGGAAGLAADPGQNAALRDTTEHLLSLAFESTVSGSRIVASDFVSFCIAVTGQAGCSASGAKVSLGDQLVAGLRLPLNTGLLWRQVTTGSTGGAEQAIASFIDATPDLTAANRTDLALRLGGAALLSLTGATGAQLTSIASQLGDSAVRTLAPTLSLKSLQDLHTLKGVVLPTASARASASQRGAAIKAVGVLAGKTAAVIRTQLTSKGLVKKSNTATEEVWAHSDGSVFRFYPSGSTVLPSKRHFVKQISMGADLSPDKMLCALTDAALPVPNLAADADKAMTVWFGKPDISGHTPTTAELRELRAVWLARTRLAYAP